MFSFLFGKRKHQRENPAPAPQTAADQDGQKRSSFRMPVAFDVFYTLQGRPGRRSARAHDLSAGGLRLTCDEDFLKDSTLLLDFSLPGDFLSTMTVEKEMYEQSPFGLRPETVKVAPPPFEPIHVNAKVLVTFFDIARVRFAHGLAFDGMPTKTEEELQRFMHLWQVNYLRHRRDAFE